MPGERPSQPIGFDDISALADREIQMILRDVETSDLVVALKGADGALRNRVLSNVSDRVRDLIRDEIEASGTVKEEQVREARLQVTRTMRQLKSVGLITWPPLKDFPVSAAGEDAPVAPRRRSKVRSKPVQRRISPAGLIGILGGLVLVVLLLVWLASLQTRPKIIAKKSPRIAFKGGGGANQDRGAKGRNRKGKGEEDEDEGELSGVTQVEGQVVVTSEGSERRAEGAALRPGDRVETGDGGRAELRLPEGTGQVEVEANSSVLLGGEKPPGTTPPELNVRVGNILVRADKAILAVRSPLAEVTASEGAVYRFRVVLDATTTVSVQRGTVWIKSLIEADVDRLVAGPGDVVTFSPKGQVVTRKHVIKMPRGGSEPF